MKTELAMESDLRLKKDQKQGGLIQKLLKEVKHLKGRNHILESQFRNFVQEEQVSSFVRCEWKSKLSAWPWFRFWVKISSDARSETKKIFQEANCENHANAIQCFTGEKKGLIERLKLIPTFENSPSHGIHSAYVA